ncbi:MAG: hypothetical protein ACYDGR_14170 [Candidatus Dormibacteria bacterium]
MSGAEGGEGPMFTAGELNAREARYRRLLDDVPVAIYRGTPEGRIIDGNRHLRTVSASDLYADLSDRRRVLEALEQSGGKARGVEVRFRRKGGRRLQGPPRT